MAVITEAVKQSEFFSRASSFLLTEYLKMRGKLFGGRGYCISQEKKLSYLELFKKSCDKYNYRVTHLALSNIVKDPQFEQYMGFTENRFNAELEKANKIIIENAEKINPRLYNPKTGNFEIIKSGETSEEYKNRINTNPYKKIGDI